MYTFESQYEKYLDLFNAYAESYCSKLSTKPSVLGESIKYSLLLGGKRIRPVLLLATAEVLHVNEKEVLPFALALEMIHTYSLVHDDLPAMDNDDFRRGKLSNHKVYGEANAILAGDGLLNTAYSICLDECLKGEKYILAAKYLCECAGIGGMIAGQSADLYHSLSDSPITEDELSYIHEQKTGKLLLAPVAIASILGGNKFFFEFERFGKYLGTLFQITDDLLDVTGDFSSLGKTVGKDEAENKLTYVKLFGVEGARIQADVYAEHCYTVLDGVDGDTEFLRDLITFVRNRER